MPGACLPGALALAKLQVALQVAAALPHVRECISQSSSEKCLNALWDSEGGLRGATGGLPQRRVSECKV